MRRGREFYSEKYDKAVELHNKGRSIKEIAAELNVSYSAAYHWIKGLRQPKTGNLTEFITYIEKSGPVPALVIKDEFPKHNELFLIAGKRGIDVRRHVMSKKLGEYRTWYYLPGQEEALQQRLDALFETIKKIAKKMSDI